MENNSIQAIQKEILNILVDFVAFCEEHQLKYYLAGGTLLGAVRHKGFIPWDDDVDVLMPRPDYEKFILLTNGKLYDKYTVFFDDTFPVNHCPFMKVVNPEYVVHENVFKAEQGIWMDIFPIDGMPDTIKEQKRHMNKMEIYDYLLWQSKSAGQLTGSNFKMLMKKIVFLPLILYGSKRFVKKMTKLARRYDYNTCSTVGSAVGRYGIKECIAKEVFEPRMKMKFEEDEFYVSKGYDTYLTNLYGNYMEIPKNRKIHLRENV